LFPPCVYASFGISPSDFTFENIIPGETVEKEFLISRTESEKEARIVIEADVEGANQWIKVEPGVSFPILRGEKTKKMKVKVSIPEDAPLRNYEGFIVVKILEGEGTPGVSLVKGVGIAVNLITTKIEVNRLLVRKMEMPNVMKGDPIRLILTIENQGNKKSKPQKIEIKVYDIANNLLFEGEDLDFESIEPSLTKDITAEFKNNLIEGEYYAFVTVVFQDKPLREEKLVFNVKEKEESISEKTYDTGGKNYLIILYGLSFLVLIISLLVLKAFFISLKKKKMNNV